MFKDFKQFVSSSVCLKCEGCCRFKEEDSRWQPHMTPSEIKMAGRLGLAEKILGPGAISRHGQITTTPHGEGCICRFFNPKDFTCGIYHARPFECRLYPFILGREDGKPAVFAHLICPFLQEHFGTSVYKEYTTYLQQFLKDPKIRDFLKSNQHLFADYSEHRQELDYVFEVSFP